MISVITKCRWFDFWTGCMFSIVELFCVAFAKLRMFGLPMECKTPVSRPNSERLWSGSVLAGQRSLRAFHGESQTSTRSPTLLHLRNVVLLHPIR